MHARASVIGFLGYRFADFNQQRLAIESILQGRDVFLTSLATGSEKTLIRRSVLVWHDLLANGRKARTV